jgi:RimJ/RimL family protein N-acetyltransferase
MEKLNKLEGEFIRLRPLQVSDAELTFQWRNAERAKYLNAAAASVLEQLKWIESRPKSEYNFIIELNNNLPVGMISLINIDHTNHHAESSRFLIGDEDAVKGIPAAVESMKILYELAFDVLNLVRISGTVAENNTLMIKWQKYLGMKEEGRLRKHLYKNGQYFDAVCLGLLIDEYRTTTVPRINGLINAARPR